MEHTIRVRDGESLWIEREDGPPIEVVLHVDGQSVRVKVRSDDAGTRVARPPRARR